MMKLSVIGYVGGEPTIHTTHSGTNLGSFSVAVSKNTEDKQTGEKITRTIWFKVIVFGYLVNLVTQYLAKGSRVYVDGKFDVKKWVDKEGMNQITYEIAANELQILNRVERENREKVEEAASHIKEKMKQPSDAQYTGNWLDEDIPF